MKPTKRPTQKEMVYRWLAANPGSTVVQIRDGIYATYNCRIERIQARLADLEKSWELHRTKVEYGRTAYALGNLKHKVKTQPTTSRMKIGPVSVTAPVELAEDIREAVQAVVDARASEQAQDDSIDLLDFLYEELV